MYLSKQIQSTLVISKSKEPSETLRDIQTSTYQMCRIEENINQTTEFLKWTCHLTPLVRLYVENIVENGRNCSWGAISSLIYNILLPTVRFLFKTGMRFSLRDKRLFESTEVEITRFDCTIRLSLPVETSYYATCFLKVAGTLNCFSDAVSQGEGTYFSRSNSVFLFLVCRLSCNKVSE